MLPLFSVISTPYTLFCGCSLYKFTGFLIFSTFYPRFAATGVLRAVYLCPSGAARHAPLSDFRAGLFRLLGSLPSRARVDSRAVALSDGMRVVRDAAALLQVRSAKDDKRRNDWEGVS